MIKFKAKNSDKLYDLVYELLSVIKEGIKAEIRQKNAEKRKNSYADQSYANLVDRITLKEAKNLMG